MRSIHSGLIVHLTSVALLDTPAANAQLADSVRSVFVTDASAGSTFTLNELVGFHIFPGEEVGAFLADNGFRNNLAGDNIAGGRTIGARTEYDFGLWETWSRPGSAGTLRGGPDMALSGFNFWLTDGIKFRQKVYDARIIAERVPESDEDKGQ